MIAYVIVPLEPSDAKTGAIGRQADLFLFMSLLLQYFPECIIPTRWAILKLSTSSNVVDNRGEDLRFPISSSSGFSSPMMGAPKGAPELFYGRKLKVPPPGLFLRHKKDRSPKPLKAGEAIFLAYEFTIVDFCFCPSCRPNRSTRAAPAIPSCRRSFPYYRRGNWSFLSLRRCN